MQTFRSKFESNFNKSILTNNVQYEKHVLPYLVPASNHKYTPDFKITGTNIFLELKGKFDLLDRKKMLLVRDQYPQYRIIMVFMQPKQTLSKASKTTYAKWCEKNNIEWMTAADALSLISACTLGHNSST